MKNRFENGEIVELNVTVESVVANDSKTMHQTTMFSVEIVKGIRERRRVCALCLRGYIPVPICLKPLNNKLSCLMYLEACARARTFHPALAF